MPPGSSRTRRAASEIDPTGDQIVGRIDYIDGIVALVSSPLDGGGLMDAFRRRVPLGENPRPFELGEKVPPRQVEPLDDEENQDGVGEIVEDVEVTRSNLISREGEWPSFSFPWTQISEVFDSLG